MTAQAEFDALRAMTPEQRRETTLAKYSRQHEGLGKLIAQELSGKNKGQRNAILDRYVRLRWSALALRAQVEYEGFSVEEAVMWQSWADWNPKTLGPRDGDTRGHAILTRMEAVGLMRSGEDGWKRQDPPPGVRIPAAVLRYTRPELNRYSKLTPWLLN